MNPARAPTQEAGKRKQKRHAVQFGGGCEEGETSMWQAASGMQDKRNQ